VSEHGSAVIAAFETAEELLAAIASLRRGNCAVETYTPHPVEGLDELLGRPPSRLPVVFLGAGLLGAAGGFLLQLWGASNYPLNVGGRPINSWPAFGPSTFEIGVLTALLVGFLAYLAAARLTRLYDPIFAAPGFQRAAQDRYLVCVKGCGRAEFEGLIEPLRPRRIAEVAA
jgi:hypothetical protein